MIVLPSQTGLFVATTGVGGGFGSVSVTGPAGNELQPFVVIMMFEYVPAVRPVMVRLPDALDERLTGPCGTLFLR